MQVDTSSQKSWIKADWNGKGIKENTGEVVIMISEQDVMKVAGLLQVCAGQEAGAEAAIHAVNDVFKDHTTEAVLLINDEKAFNAINRKAMLHNISVLCPIVSTYINNCYNTPVHYCRGRYFLKGKSYTTESNSDGILCFRSYAIVTASSKDSVIQQTLLQRTKRQMILL